MTQLSKDVIDKIRVLQTNEITEYIVYTHLAKRLKDDHNKNILLKIGEDELAHANIWKSYTNEDIKPKRLTILYYDILNVIFGYTFTLKMMEKGEEKANKYYDEIAEVLPIAKKIADEEEEHEMALIAMLDEERLQYVGSMVLGLNDALVELTGTIAGLSFALQNTKLVALSGLVTGHQRYSIHGIQ
jgi:vacuolar iron transporter family protein